MTRIKRWMAVAGAGLAMVVLGVVALPAAAASAPLAPAASTQPAPAYHGGRIGGDDGQYLADALGITLTELQTAQQAATEAGIQKALDERLITQAQADALKARSGLGRLGGRGHWGFFGSETIDPEALLADALNISVDELQAARAKAQATAVDQAVTDGRITQEQADMMQAQQALRAYLEEQGLQGRVRTLYEDAIQQAVQAGVITQAQADAILADTAGFGKLGAMRGFGGRHGGMRGGEMPGDVAPSGTPNSTSPSGLLQAPGAETGIRL